MNIIINLALAIIFALLVFIDTTKQTLRELRK